MARRMTSSELVGRTDAVEQVLAAVTSAQGGEARHVLVNGEAGVGKTRLLSRTGELAQDDGVRVLIGGCVSMGEAGLPFAPYAEILRALVADEGAAQTAAFAGRAAVDLARLVPALGAEDTSPSQELWAPSRLYEALLDLLRRMAATAPLMVQLEDLHWADAGTLAATSFLFRSIRDEPIVIVATIRTDEVTRKHPLRPWLAEVSRAERVERIDLEPLTAAESAQLVRNITGIEQPVDALDDIHRRSDGNPFFVEELLASGADKDRFLPSSLRDVLLARVDALGSSAQDLLAVAAIGGREVDHDVLVSVSGRSGPDLTHDIRVLVDAGLLVPISELDHDGYAFRHALLQEAVHDAMLPPERRRLHRAYAERLEERGDADSADASLLLRLAHHWREARDDRALDASIRAADAASSSYAYASAVEEYDHALALWDDDAAPRGDGIDHVELLARAGNAAYLSAQNRRSVAIVRQAMEELGEDGDGARRAELGFVLGRALWVTGGEWRASLEAYEQAVEAAPPAPHLARIRALAGLGQAYMLFGWLSRSRPLCEEAVGLARSVGARDLEGHALNSLSVTLAGMGEGDTASDAIKRALAIAEELRIPDDIGRAYVNQGDVLNWAGYPDRALESTRRGIEASIGTGMESMYGTYLRINAVMFAYAIGEWGEARELLDAAARSGDASVGFESYRAEYALGFLVSSGDPDATRTWESVRRMHDKHPPSATMHSIFMAAVEAACFDGRLEDAAQLGLEGLELLQEIDGFNRIDDMARVAARPLADLGIRARATDDGAGLDTVRKRLDAIVQLMSAARTSMGDLTDRLRQVIDAQEAQVGMERSRLIGEDTVSDWRDLSERWLQLGRPYIQAYALWRAAQAADVSSARDGAVDALRGAHGIAQRLGAAPMSVELAVVARKLNVRLGSSQSSSKVSDGADFGLTPREREVLGLVATGKTNKQIAAELFISESTAGVHVSNILSKLGVSTRTEAARVALGQGLVR